MAGIGSLHLTETLQLIFGRKSRKLEKMEGHLRTKVIKLSVLKTTFLWFLELLLTLKCCFHLLEFFHLEDLNSALNHFRMIQKMKLNCQTKLEIRSLLNNRLTSLMKIRLLQIKGMSTEQVQLMMKRTKPKS